MNYIIPPLDCDVDMLTNQHLFFFLMRKVLGIKIVGHDTGAALIVDGQIVAIAEERLNRIKHTDLFPLQSIDYCLNSFCLKPTEIDLIVIDQVGYRNEALTKKAFNQKTHDAFAGVRVEIVNHHNAHAASAFYACSFEKAAVLVYDGSGERFLTHHGVYTAETETLLQGEGNRLETLHKFTHAARRGPQSHFPYTIGIGKLYSFLSKIYLAFGPYNEGKMMGLAPYGDLSLLELIPEDNWFKEIDGQVMCNARFVIPRRQLAVVGSIFEGIIRVLRFVALAFSKPHRATAPYLYRGLYRAPNIFKPIRLPKPSRKMNGPLPDHYYASVARASQHILEQVATIWGKRLRRLVESENICVSGGLGLNIDANPLFLNKVGFRRLFVPPGASDGGIALGCALWGYHMVLGEKRFYEMRHAYLGRSYREDEILAALDKFTGEISHERILSITNRAARLLAEGKIVGWFQGGSEYGPRALGHRSILADARRGAAKDELNSKIKHREAWRPFATSILKDKASEYFELEHESPFMLLAAKARPGVREKVPAVIHVDNTSRIQTVTREDNGRYFDLINEFYHITGVPIILNTSFNLAGDPIVETPADALSTFMRTGMDYLIIEDILITKK